MGPRKQYLSMMRSYTQADLFTLGNASCGTISIFLCLNYTAEGRSQYFWIAFLLLFAALGCDIMDGYWSRKSGRHSVLAARGNSQISAPKHVTLEMFWTSI